MVEVTVSPVLPDDDVMVTVGLTVLRSIIWTPSSSSLTTMAYVLESITNVATPFAPSSSVKPFTPSVSASVAEMF